MDHGEIFGAIDQGPSDGSVKGWMVATSTSETLRLDMPSTDVIGITVLVIMSLLSS